MRFADDNLSREGRPGGLTPKILKIMVVEFNTGGANYVPLRQAAARRAAETPTDNSVSFETTQLAKQLPQAAAEVRPEKIARAAALVADSNYPSAGQLGQLAGFLAKRL